MSLLIVEIPPRARAAPRHEATTGNGESPTMSAEWFYVLSADGRSVSRSGQAAATLLPRADTVVAVLDAADVAWHRVSLPRMGSAKLRAALAGLLEEELLDEPESVHLALGTASGTSRWVAAVHKDWLGGLLAGLENAGHAVDRVVPMLAPATGDGAGARGWFDVDPDAGDAQTARLTLATADGVCCVPASGGLARHLIPADAPVAFSATPAAAAAAERWFGAPVAVAARAGRLLEASAADLNLRQFELAPHHRGTRLLRDGAHRLMGREWRWLRWGAAALLVVQLVGLNLYAWQQDRQLAGKRAAMVELLKAAHPQVRAVLDAPLQMQRETDALRAAAGRPGAADFEALLAAASAAWPEGSAPVQMMRFEPGRLALTAPGFGSAQLAPMRERLRASGFDAELAEGRLQITRGGGGSR